MLPLVGCPRKTNSRDYIRENYRLTYTLEFCTLAATSGWNEAVLLSAFHLGLNPCLRAQMAIYDDNMGLESFMQRTSCILQHLLPVCTVPLQITSSNTAP